MPEQSFTADEAAFIVTKMRSEVGLEPERFAMSQFVGMISDEIDLLRQRGKSDEQIAAFLQANGANVTVQDLQRHYASPQKRGHRPHD